MIRREEIQTAIPVGVLRGRRRNNSLPPRGKLGVPKPPCPVSAGSSEVSDCSYSCSQFSAVQNMGGSLSMTGIDNAIPAFQCLVMQRY